MVADLVEAIQVKLAPNGFYPRSFRWQRGSIRVLSIESVQTFGAERRFRARTARGYFELGLYTNTGAWYVRQSPNMFGRLWARWQNTPRYPLPVWRRRARRNLQARSPVPVMEGGNHADWFAVV